MVTVQDVKERWEKIQGDDERILFIVGGPGSGKSLIAKVICNAVKENWIITADRFRFDDVELLKLNPNQRRKLVGKEISMIFQDPLSCLEPSRKVGKQLIQSIPNWTFKGRWWQWFGWVCLKKIIARTRIYTDIYANQQRV